MFIGWWRRLLYDYLEMRGHNVAFDGWLLVGPFYESLFFLISSFSLVIVNLKKRCIFTDNI